MNCGCKIYYEEDHWAVDSTECCAPELYEALKALITFPGVIDVLAPIESLGSIHRQCLDALAKAKG